MTWKLLAAVLACAAPLAAQEPGNMPQTMPGPLMREMTPAMMKLMLYAPQHVLARRSALGLTPDQVTRLTALRDAAQHAGEAAEAEAKDHMQALAQAADVPKPDTGAIRVHFQAAHGAMGKAHWAMLAAALQARAILTDAQRGSMQAWADSMQAWMQQHRQMMKPSEPR
jgi:LTXXQ motif family protein